MIYGILLFVIITFIILSTISMDAPLIYLLPLGIVIYSLWIIYIGSVSIDLKKSHILSTLNVKIYEKAIIMPDWDTNQSTKTKIYPIDMIDKIYWNEGYDHLLLIKSEKGIKISKNRLGHEMLYKNIIDNKKDFKRALQKTGKLIEDEEMDISEWLKRREI